MNTATPITELARKYWQDKHQFYLEHLSNYNILRDEKNYEKYLINKKGLLGGSSVLVDDSMEIIASGLEDLGLAKASMAKKYAESALHAGDLIYANEPAVEGKHEAYGNLAEAKWILEKPDWQSLHHSSAQYWCDYLSEAGVQPGKFDAFLREMHLWEAVLPFLLVDDIERAVEEFHSAGHTFQLDPTKLAQNSKTTKKTFGLILLYLCEDSGLRDLAMNTLVLYRRQISKWGYDGKTKADRLWHELSVRQHVLVAKLWAKYFSKVEDPITIIQSITG